MSYYNSYICLQAQRVIDGVMHVTVENSSTITSAIRPDEAFDKVAADHRTRSTWNWSPTGNNQTHCSRSAYEISPSKPY